MYDRVLILAKDQHVNLFFWRSLDACREADVYVKTVLTFGDKLVTTMAQTALQKTADENKTIYPQTTKAIKDNSYMDDICDPVDEVERACQRTKDIDEILVIIGFNVKEWI